MGDSYYPAAYGGGQLDFSGITQAAKGIAGGLTDMWNNQSVRKAWAESGGDFNVAVQKMLEAGDTDGAARLAKIGSVVSDGGMTPYQREDLRLKALALEQKPPATTTAGDQTMQWKGGNWEPLGEPKINPQDVKAQRDQASIMKGKENLSKLLGRLTDTINELDVEGGMVSPENTMLENVGAYVGSSEYGQKVGAAMGTENQSKRKQMLNMRTVVSNLVRQASGMSAKAFDSNYELQTYLNSIADPQVDKIANLVAIDVLDQSFGLGGLLDNKLPQEVLQQVRAGSAESMRTRPIQTDAIDQENPDVPVRPVRTQSFGAPEIAPATMPGELPVQNQPLAGPQGAPMNRPLAPGMIVGGFRFKGGNPNDPNAWEQAQ
jgi:hypothetical protein